MAYQSSEHQPPVLVFDLGGVLCSFSTERRLAAFADACGSSPDELKLLLEDSRLIHMADRGQLDLQSEYRLATSVFGLECDYPTYRALWCSALQVNAEVIEIARALGRRHQTAILTNNGPVLLDALRHDLKAVGECFDHLFVSAMFGAIKPAEEVFRGVERELGVASNRLLLIDDSEANVAGARRCGWHAIRFTSAQQLREDVRLLLQVAP